MASSQNIPTTPDIRSSEQVPPVQVRVSASANLPSEFGAFKLYVFSNNHDSSEHLAIVRGEIAGKQDVLTRLHSECLTGDVLASLRCDCRAQLQRALARLGEEPQGVVLYLRQEGRGIGLTNKIRAYALQEVGLDTVDANLALGLPADARDYSVAAAMLRFLAVGSVALMTNNPDKILQLRAQGITVTRREPHQIAPNSHNRFYLETKALRSGHLLGAGVATADVGLNGRG